MANWTTKDIPSLQGKVAVVTGANAGIGFATAFWLAFKGAHVVMACRSLEKAKAAAAEMEKLQPGLDLELVPLDLASLESVRSCAAVIRERHTRLDLLINNAGLMALPFRKTGDGFEMQFGVNHLGHFALTALLGKLWLNAPAARIVTVSSMAHRTGKMDFDNLNGEKGYSKWSAYGQSKLANLLFAYELQRRLAARGSQAISLAINPGYVNTNLHRVGPQMEEKKLWEGILTFFTNLMGQSPLMGALNSLYAASAPDAQGGDYIQPALFTAWGWPKRSRSSSASYDPTTARRLWDVSEQLTKIRFEI